MSPSVVRTWAGIAIAGAALLLAAGVGLPIIELKRFFIFEDGYSILAMFQTLAREGEWFLAAIVGLFAVVFPAAKIAALALIVARPRVSCRSTWITTTVDWLGKWSMLDVLVVAVLIVAVKVSGIQKAATQPGVYCFVASIALTFVAGRLAKRLLIRPAGSA